MKVVALTMLALVAFAANSVLCRLALKGELIDSVSFTSIRLVSAAAVLFLISRFSKEKKESNCMKHSWRSGLALYLYTISFSAAYLSVSAGTGALLLFGAVQITMLLAAWRAGERMGTGQWVGFAIAIVGLVYLLLPSSTAPNLVSACLMVISGIAWGSYSIAGRGETAPITMTANNFLWAAPMALVTSAISFSQASVELNGMMLALGSGVITSGFGYGIWYLVLPMLSTTHAAMLQLLVPPLATFGGVIFISEQFTLRMGIASFLVLGGVGYAVLQKVKPNTNRTCV